MYVDNNVTDGFSEAWGGSAEAMLGQAQDARNLAGHYHARVRSMQDIADIPSVPELAREAFDSHPDDYGAAYGQGLDAINAAFRKQEISLREATRYENLGSNIARNLTRSDYLAGADPPRFRSDDYDNPTRRLRNEQMSSDARAKEAGVERTRFSHTVVKSHRDLYRTAFISQLSSMYPGPHLDASMLWPRERHRYETTRARAQESHVLASENYMTFNLQDRKLHSDLSADPEYQLAARTLHDLVRPSQRDD